MHFSDGGKIIIYPDEANLGLKHKNHPAHNRRVVQRNN